ncbi:aldehyde dehydrogenase family protein [Phycicoccus sp.]|uniref:aldehyde dehydrogenase family protein n=1 Tax=Phycicoccus sp. TaxID=1902410 RepID=UPI002CB27200|nr:aldehyde dehydrogenase family protein [Phycicoccus sp.]HMM94048.1 aldehyde dehydrogenase family protein [Phycicoccus sp.]
MTINAPTGSDTFNSWINGSWRAGDTSYRAINPAEGATFATLTSATAADVDAAVSSARAAFEKTRSVRPATRAQWCRSAASALMAAHNELAEVLSTEHGKPITEARGEILFAVQGLESAAESVLALGAELPHVQDPNKRVIVRREGLGVCAVVTPWNFPVNIAVEYIGPALAAGNAIVWKPAPTTSVVATKFREILLVADFPQELLQLVITDSVKVATHLVTHPDVVAVGFTGGSGTGRSIAQSAWDKKLLLELGGNSAVVVLADADLEVAASAIANSAFWNAGQVCSAAGKILVADPCVDDLAQLLADHAEGAVIGSPLDSRTTLGPVHLESGITRYDRLIQNAERQGAKVVTGGGRLSDKSGFFYAPTVLASVGRDAAIFSEETFGPVAALTSFHDEEHMLQAANSGEFGLVASLFTTSLAKAFQFGEKIDAGLVVVNDSSNYWEFSLPFGGAAGRQSGRGRLGGRWVIDEFSQVKSLAIDVR